MSARDSLPIRELLQELANTPLGVEMRELEQHRQGIYQELAEHDDPLLREIGKQLRDRVIRPHQLLDIPGYDAVVEERIKLLQQVDPDAVRAELADYIDSAKHDRDRPTWA